MEIRSSRRPKKIIFYLSLAVFFIAAVYLSVLRRYLPASILLIIISFLLIAARFEWRRPKAREVILISVLSALAVAGRAIFFLTPQIKPGCAIIILASIYFGGETGVLTGMLTGFLSNILFSQGPWTPWQMLGYALCGFAAGLLGKIVLVGKNRFIMAITGFLAALILYGATVNIGMILLYFPEPTPAAIWGYYLLSLPFDLIHSFSTGILLLLLGPAMGKRFIRLKTKYGLLAFD